MVWWVFHWRRRNGAVIKFGVEEWMPGFEDGSPPLDSFRCPEEMMMTTLVRNFSAFGVGVPKVIHDASLPTVVPIVESFLHIVQFRPKQY